MLASASPELIPAGVALLLGAWLATAARAQSAAEDLPLAAAPDSFLGSELSPVPGGLTAELAAQAAERHPSVRAQRAQLTAARAQRDELLWSYAPRLQLEARYTRWSEVPSPELTPSGTGLLGYYGGPNPDTGLIDPERVVIVSSLRVPPLTEQKLARVSLSVPLSDYLLKLGHDLEATEQSVNAARMQAEAARRDAAFHARLAFYRWVQARGQRVLASQAHAVVQAQLADARSGAAAGVVSMQDVLRLEAEVAANASELHAAQAAESQQELALRHAMGGRSGPIRLGEPLLIALPPAPVEREEQLEARALAASPALRALEAARAEAEARAAATSVTMAPRLDGAVSASYGSPNPRTTIQSNSVGGAWEAAVSLTWNLSEAPRASARADALRARATELSEQIALLRAELSERVREALWQQQIALANIASARAAERAASQVQEARSSQFRAGRASALEIADANAAVVRARVQLLHAYLDLRVSRASLAHLTGAGAS